MIKTSINRFVVYLYPQVQLWVLQTYKYSILIFIFLSRLQINKTRTIMWRGRWILIIYHTIAGWTNGMEIVTETRIKIVRQGESTHIDCRIDKVKADQIKKVQMKQESRILGTMRYNQGSRTIWKDSKKPTKNLNTICDTRGISIIIRHMNKEDEGNFACSLIYKGERIKEIFTQLRLYLPPGPPRLSNKEGRVIGKEWQVKANTTEGVKCTSSGGVPSPTITWIKNFNSTIAGIKENNRDYASEAIKIKNKQEDGNTTLTCLATNKATKDKGTTSVSKTIRIQTIYPPHSITMDYSGDPMEAEKEHSIKCKTQGGHPEPVIIWKLDNKTATHPTIEHTTKEDKISILLLTPSHKDHLKQLECRAKTPRIGRNIRTARTIKVTYKPICITEILNTWIRKTDMSIELRCPVWANPTENLTIEWFKVRETGNLTLEDIKKPILIHRLGENISRTYKCKAKNSIGNQENPCTVIIRGEPKEDMETSILTSKRGSIRLKTLVSYGMVLITIGIIINYLSNHYKKLQRIGTQYSTATLDMPPPMKIIDTWDHRLRRQERRKGKV